MSLVPGSPSTSVSSGLDNDVFTVGRRTVSTEHPKRSAFVHSLNGFGRNHALGKGRGCPFLVWWPGFWVSLVKSIFCVPLFPLSVAILSLGHRQIPSSMDCLGYRRTIIYDLGIRSLFEFPGPYSSVVTDKQNIANHAHAQRAY